MNRQIKRAQLKAGLYLYLLPTYTQAKKVIWNDAEMMKHFPNAVIENKNNSELTIKFKNGSLWQLGGADNPDSWRGTNPIDVVFDEYSEMKEDIWNAIIRPVLASNNGTATFIFTPKGTNHAWKIFQYAKANKGKYWDWFFYTIKDTHAISEEELEEARKTMPEAMYKQEFLCEFLENAGQVFRRIKENIHEDELDIQPEKSFTLGVDLAKYNDFTVLTPFDLNTGKVGRLERFNQIDWNLQKARIEATARRYNNARVKLDSTGLGDPIYDDLRKQGLNLDEKPFKFTEISRAQILNNLAILLEQDKIKIPKDENLINELMSFQYKVGEKGRIKAVAPDNMHDDTVMSLALAVWGFSEPLLLSAGFYEPIHQRY